MNYGEYAIRDLRLVLLRALARQPRYTANEAILQKEAEAFGHSRSRDAIRNELRYLSGVSAVRLVEESGYIIATLTRRGHDHAEGLAEVEGVNKPSPKE